MPRALALAVRQAIVQRHLQGETLAAIAADLHLPWSTVRTLWRRHRDRGAAGLPADYARCRTPGAARRHPLVDAACDLKRQHPTWGAGLIRLELRRQAPGQPVPSARALQRGFRRAGLNRPYRRRLPQEEIWARRPHEVWQVDAVEKTRLASGRLASWLTVLDEASGAILACELSPPGAMARAGAGRRSGDDAGDVRPVGFAPADPRR